jgi:hypothetical protein
LAGNTAFAARNPQNNTGLRFWRQELATHWAARRDRDKNRARVDEKRAQSERIRNIGHKANTGAAALNLRPLRIARDLVAPGMR